MATGKATNQVGQLYVDIMLGGVAKTLKGLNSISASFLLTKTAATQALKPFVNFGKEATNNAVQIGKMSAMFGFTMIEYQKLHRYLKDHSLSESLIGDMTKLSDQFTQFKKYGINSFSPMQLIAANDLGINLMDYTGSIDDMMRLVEDVQKGMNRLGLDTDSARIAMQNLGMNAEWLYAFQRGDFSLRDALTIPDSDVENMIEMQEAWNRTINDLKTAGQTFVGRIAPVLIRVIERAEPLVEKLLLWTDKILGKIPDAETLDKKIDSAGGFLKAGGAGAGAGFLLGGPVGAVVGGAGGLALEAVRQDHLEHGGFNFNNVPNASAYNPSRNKDVSVNLHVNNDVKINANNPEEVAKAINGIDQQSILRGSFKVTELINRWDR